MEDFKASDGRFVFEPVSDYPAYTMRLTARDLARFGWLYLNRGSWNDKPIVPATWADESTRAWSQTEGRLGYGYLWWVMPSAMTVGNRRLSGSRLWRAGAGGHSGSSPGRRTTRRCTGRSGAHRRAALLRIAESHHRRSKTVRGGSFRAYGGAGPALLYAGSSLPDLLLASA